MNYDSFSADDFIKDEYFQQWVFAPDEKSDAFWQRFMEQHPQRQGEIQEARRFLLVFDLKEKDVLDSRIANLKKRIDHALDRTEDPFLQQTGETHHTGKTGRIFRYQPFAIAASITAVILCTVFFFGEIKWSDVLTAGINEMVTQKGQRSLVTLNDGTKVWLNADSHLKYPDSFAGQKQREVYLEGEAFFDVTENKEQPFIVNTSDLKVKVLGTAFNVRSYRKDQTAEATLVRGKVNIESTGKTSRQITLLPNQKVVLEKRSGKLLLENQVDTEKDTAWRDGKLIFEDQPLSEIVLALERWYNVTIRVEDTSSLGCRFSAKVDNKSLEEVLELFKASENIEYRIDGNRVVIQGKLCAE